MRKAVIEKADLLQKLRAYNDLPGPNAGFLRRALPRVVLVMLRDSKGGNARLKKSRKFSRQEVEHWMLALTFVTNSAAGARSTANERQTGSKRRASRFVIFWVTILTYSFFWVWVRLCFSPFSTYTTYQSLSSITDCSQPP